MSLPCKCPWPNLHNNIWWRVLIIQLFIILRFYIPLLYVHILSALFSDTLCLTYYVEWEIKVHTFTKQQVKLWFCMFKYLDSHTDSRTINFSEVNGSKRSLHLMCFRLLHECDIDGTVVPKFLKLPHFLRIFKLCVVYNFVCIPSAIFFCIYL
jgi:hypothetical protein